MSDVTTTDTLIRAMTDDGAFRVVAAITTQTTHKAALTQNATGDMAGRFAELLTGSILVRETMAPGLRVQGLVKGGNNTGGLVADSHPDGGTRGLIQRSRAGGDVTFGPGALLQMLRTLPNGELHRGVVEIPAAGGMSDALMQYFATSEQVASMVAVGNVLENGAIRMSGGYLVQLLPEVVDGPLAVMTERLKDFTDMSAMLAQGLASPRAIIDEILYAMDFTVLEEKNLQYQCRCSEAALVGSLSTLSQEEIADLTKDDNLLDIQCDYCATPYQIAPALLRGLLAHN